MELSFSQRTKFLLNHYTVSRLFKIVKQMLVYLSHSYGIMTSEIYDDQIKYICNIPIVFNLIRQFVYYHRDRAFSLYVL